MATERLSDSVQFGLAIPHRAHSPIAVDDVVAVAQRAETLGFHDLWVTDNTLSVPGREFCFDPLIVLSHVAAHTARIRLGTAVLVLPIRHPAHVAHQIACLDYLSGGRAELAVGIGRDFNYAEFNVPPERRVRRFLESTAVLRGLWAGERVEFDGELVTLHGSMQPVPVQQRFPLWFGGTHPNAVRRAARHADGWIGSGGQSLRRFGESVAILSEALTAAERSDFPVSKRLFVAVDDSTAAAKAELDRWFGEFGGPGKAQESGVYGTAEQVRQQLADLAGLGATHLLLNATARYREHVELLADVVGLG